MVYVLFIVGWYTCVFYVLLLFCLVSLCGCNVLVDVVGNHVVIVMLGFTAFLPCGL